MPAQLTVIAVPVVTVATFVEIVTGAHRRVGGVECGASGVGHHQPVVVGRAGSQAADAGADLLLRQARPERLLGVCEP